MNIRSLPTQAPGMTQPAILGWDFASLANLLAQQGLHTWMTQNDAGIRVYDFPAELAICVDPGREGRDRVDCGPRSRPPVNDADCDFGLEFCVIGKPIGAAEFTTCMTQNDAGFRVCDLTAKMAICVLVGCEGRISVDCGPRSGPYDGSGDGGDSNDSAVTALSQIAVTG